MQCNTSGYIILVLHRVRTELAYSNPLVEIHTIRIRNVDEGNIIIMQILRS